MPCGKPKDDVKKAIDAYEAMLKTTDYKGKTMIWLDIERYKWGHPIQNRAFITDMLSVSLPANFEYGVYSSFYSWEEIVGTDWDYPAKKGVPLWYAHYDDKPSFSDFKPFGGWVKPFAK